jgi:hypothetical protein
MPKMNQDERIVGITAVFFDDKGRPATIDVQDGPPEWNASDPAVLTFVSPVVAPDGKSATVEVWGGAVGAGVTISVLADANMGAGTVETIILSWDPADPWEVTPGPAGQASSGTLSGAGPAVPKP